MLDDLSVRLSKTLDKSAKKTILDSFSAVDQFFMEKGEAFYTLLSDQGIDSELAFKQLILIGQAKRFFPEGRGIKEEELQSFLQKLVEIDQFYREIGGIAGYQAKILQLIFEKKRQDLSDVKFHQPPFLNIAEETEEVKEAISWGIDFLPQMAEIYPLGGAADRLHLTSEEGEELPAAKLPFAGRTLFEQLIRDLQAREALYFQKYGVSLTTPIAIMTSHEKNNHKHIIEICEQMNYFGRPRDSIRFFTQPLVPVVDEKGDWCVMGPLAPLLKPGGHGAVWKLARDAGIFDWFLQLGRKKTLLRQINNPIAGLDYGLLAFTGIGCKKEMLFGFASCPRLLKSAEGVNVLIEKGQRLALVNVEYCDFAKSGIEDCPIEPDQPYSRFSSNTNILFADLKALSSAIDQCPFPGLLINLKKGSYIDVSGEKRELAMARLESTMQNIADVFVEEKKIELKTEKTFITYNVRHKTISTAKKAFSGDFLQETPENCFYDLLTAHRELLHSCGFHLPKKREIKEYLEKGPEFLFLYHPALGPLYSTLRKKLMGGSFSLGSELILELCNFQAKNLKLCGSLQIIAENPLSGASCILENVKIENRGVNWSKSRPFWKMGLQREESVKIILKGKGKLIARNLHLQGNHTLIVEDGQTIETISP